MTAVGTPATVKPTDEPFTRISSSAPASVIVSLRRPTPFTSLNTTSIVDGNAERLIVAPRSGDTRSAVGNSTGAVDDGVGSTAPDCGKMLKPSTRNAFRWNP